MFRKQTILIVYGLTLLYQVTLYKRSGNQLLKIMISCLYFDKIVKKENKYKNKLLMKNFGSGEAVHARVHTGKFIFWKKIQVRQSRKTGNIVVHVSCSPGMHHHIVLSKLSPRLEF